MTTVAPGLSEFARSLSPRKNSFPARPVFDDIQDERQFRKQRLAAALRLFDKLGYNEGAAGHITVRDPELPDHLWVNPFGRAFSRIKASELLLVNHGLLTVGRSLEETVSLHVAAERNSKVQVVAQAAGLLQLIPHVIAQHIKQQYQQHRDPGWVTFAPLFEEIVHEQPDLLD